MRRPRPKKKTSGESTQKKASTARASRDPPPLLRPIPTPDAPRFNAIAPPGPARTATMHESVAGSVGIASRAARDESEGERRERDTRRRGTESHTPWSSNHGAISRRRARSRHEERRPLLLPAAVIGERRGARRRGASGEERRRIGRSVSKRNLRKCASEREERERERAIAFRGSSSRNYICACHAPRSSHLPIKTDLHAKRRRLKPYRRLLRVGSSPLPGPPPPPPAPGISPREEETSNVYSVITQTVINF